MAISDSAGAARDLLSLVREGRRLLAEAGAAEAPLRCAGCERAAGLDDTFCVGCGARLRFPCPRCEAPCRAGEAHCGACGVSLTHDLVDDRLAELSRRDEEERRRREEDLLRRYARTKVVQEGRVRHLVGTLDSGETEFVKVARGEAGRRLLRNEADALERIGEHPGVIRLRERREDDDKLVCTFEHVRGAPLRFPLSIPRVLQIVRDALRTLEHVHGRGIVHADLKPEHLVLPAGRAPVLIDWNIAQEPGPSRFGAYTPLFASPEQVVGDRVDFRADLYAMGVILYMLFTHDRFPAVLEEQGEAEPMLKVLQAKKAMNRAFLTEHTIYSGKLASLAKGQLQQNALPGGPPPGGGPEHERKVLGAKYMFSSELSRTQDVNAEIRATGGVLAIVQRATAVDPADRFGDAASMRAAVEAVLARVSPPDRAPDSPQDSPQDSLQAGGEEAAC